MDDILELVLEVWLLTLRLFPFGPVQGPRDARPDTPRDKRTQYILRPALWTVLALSLIHIFSGGGRVRHSPRTKAAMRSTAFWMFSTEAA